MTLRHRKVLVRLCRSCAHVVRSLTNILQYGGTGSVNFYMAHGGSNFAFWAGCNGDEFDMTSYDYNCPISESAKTGQPGVGGPNKFEVCSLSMQCMLMSVY